MQALTDASTHPWPQLPPLQGSTTHVPQAKSQNQMNQQDCSKDAASTLQVEASPAMSSTVDRWWPAPTILLDAPNKGARIGQQTGKLGSSMRNTGMMSNMWREPFQAARKRTSGRQRPSTHSGLMSSASDGALVASGSISEALWGQAPTVVGDASADISKKFTLSVQDSIDKELMMTRGSTAPTSQSSIDLQGDEELKEYRREVLSRLMIDAAGGPKEAFLVLDLNGNGKISFSEFEAGIATLGVDWQDVVESKNLRDVWNLFDTDPRRGFLNFRRLFPDGGEEEDVRASTPLFWRHYLRESRDTGTVSAARWNHCFEDELEHHSDMSKTREAVSDKKKWMSSTMRRLKSLGKSDARCREIVALHLPKGTGPKDRQDVSTFSKNEVWACKKRYNDKIAATSKDVEHAFFDMRQQRQQLHASRNLLHSVTLEAQLQAQEMEVQKRRASIAGKLFSSAAGESESFPA